MEVGSFVVAVVVDDNSSSEDAASLLSDGSFSSPPSSPATSIFGGDASVSADGEDGVRTECSVDAINTFTTPLMIEKKQIKDGNRQGQQQ